MCFIDVCSFSRSKSLQLTILVDFILTLVDD